MSHHDHPWIGGGLSDAERKNGRSNRLGPIVAGAAPPRRNEDHKVATVRLQVKELLALA